jgi:hypothetical protein
MANKTIVKPYTRKVGRKSIRVKGYKRKRRKISRKPKQYKKVGILMIGHDKYGNIVGNKIVPIRPKKVKKKANKKRVAKARKPRKAKTTRELPKQYISGEINIDEYLNSLGF